MSLQNCYNFNDFRKLAKKKLPSPIFHYIDGGADDEITLKRNTNSFDDCDLVPNILASVGKPDLSTTIFGKKIDMPVFLSPCAMQRLYHHDGDKASARAADKFGTFYIGAEVNIPISSIAVTRLKFYYDGAIYDNYEPIFLRGNYFGIKLKYYLPVNMESKKVDD